jgi:hypothetical protein
MRPEHYYKQITKQNTGKRKTAELNTNKKKYREKSISCTLTPYKEKHGGSSSRWGHKKSPVVDGGRRNRCREDRQNCKNKETKKKKDQPEVSPDVNWPKRCS